MVEIVSITVQNALAAVESGNIESFVQNCVDYNGGKASFDGKAIKPTPTGTAKNTDATAMLGNLTALKAAQEAIEKMTGYQSISAYIGQDKLFTTEWTGTGANKLNAFATNVQADATNLAKFARIDNKDAVKTNAGARKTAIDADANTDAKKATYEAFLTKNAGATGKGTAGEPWDFDATTFDSKTLMTALLKASNSASGAVKALFNDATNFATGAGVCKSNTFDSSVTAAATTTAIKDITAVALESGQLADTKPCMTIDKANVVAMFKALGDASVDENTKLDDAYTAVQNALAVKAATGTGNAGLEAEVQKLTTASVKNVAPEIQGYFTSLALVDGDAQFAEKGDKKLEEVINKAATGKESDDTDINTGVTTGLKTALKTPVMKYVVDNMDFSDFKVAQSSTISYECKDGKSDSCAAANKLNAEESRTNNVSDKSTDDYIWNVIWAKPVGGTPATECYKGGTGAGAEACAGKLSTSVDLGINTLLQYETSPLTQCVEGLDDSAIPCA